MSSLNPSARDAPPPWVWIAAAGAIIAAAAIGAIGNGDNDLTGNFVPAAREVLAGHPLAIYVPRPDGIPADDGPLSLIGLALVMRLVSWAGIMAGVGLRVVIATICGGLALAAGREAWLAVEGLRGAPLHWRERIALAAIVAANPVLWRGIAHYGHFELALLLWFGLRGIRLVTRGRLVVGAIWLGLALLSRSTAVLLIVPVLCALGWERRWHDLTRLGGVVAGVTLIGLAPFLLVYPAATIYALGGYRAQLPVGAGAIWVTVIDTPLEGPVQRSAALLTVVAASAWCGWALWRGWPRGAPPGAVSATETIWLLVALATLTFPWLSTMVWPYYYTEAIAPLAIWGVTQWKPTRTAVWWYAAIPVVGMLYAEVTLHFYPFEIIGYLLGLAQGIGLFFCLRWLGRQAR